MLAKKFGLPNMDRPDSQGVCFLGEIDIKKFIKENIKVEPGNVIDINGNIIGTHDGSELYTIGERHGFTLNINANEPYYVISKDIKNNTITVTNNKSLELGNKVLYLTEQNWLPDVPKQNKIYEVQTRYHGEYYKVKFNLDSSIDFIDQAPLIAEGQSIVFYDGNMCIGGGVANFK